ncbi:hypothetical protein RWV98_17770 [Agathobaculum sp. NTUH-O15-33]|uniref:hypothetical protein n=1 Tax=Agathobaculum sp. NTUH-O15-33 TaxID=3079302 RepID=UPI002958C1F9|nr:hypothetical protein [Agathobaculum sp. NTUH-O15-33]WNX84399.1 hypothetical protein RWV98_17770 [Agathobaculum sp. NTUH-O15-33]
MKAQTTFDGGGGESMNNLKAEMRRNNISFCDLARAIDKTERCVRDKASGRAAFTFPEALKIRDTYFCGMSLEYLFAGLCEPVGDRAG